MPAPSASPPRTHPSTSPTPTDHLGSVDGVSSTRRSRLLTPAE
uniref:Uncharacterized protein n=1 Tax=Arundo donax TaxID=35708 RepID=A0A0A8XY90_ARUDO